MRVLLAEIRGALRELAAPEWVWEEWFSRRDGDVIEWNARSMVGALCDPTAQDSVRWALSWGALPIWSLRGADLRGLDGEGASLEGLDLADAHLERANLRGADLSRSNLLGAHMEGADLRGANLWGVTLSPHDLEGANLLGAIYKTGPLPEGWVRDAEGRLLPRCPG